MLSTFFASLRHWVHLVTYSWLVLGPRMIAKNLYKLALDPGAGHEPSGFDARWGTDTESELTPAEAQMPADRRTAATMYLPTLDRDLDAMLEGLAWPEALIKSSTFVDIGSGKGRVVLLAAMRRFREVIGVELSPVLHAVAERNLARVEAAGALASPVRLALVDATELEVPAGPLVIYLYHPFPDAIAERVLARIRASLADAPRPVAILYGHPTLQRCIDPGVFARGGQFMPVREGERRTRSFRIGWSIWTNESWLDLPSARPQRVAS
jgi:SAM-dependent methyltransferase